MQRKPLPKWVARHVASQQSWVTRCVFRIFGRRINAVVSRVLCIAYSEGTIDSHQLHELAAQFDPTQRGAAGLISGRRAA